MKPARLPANVRQRRRPDGSVRLWWEPNAKARALGFAPVELDADRLTWSAREAARINADLAAAIRRGGREAPAPAVRSVDGLIAHYRQSALWRKLRPATQADYAGAFRLIGRKWGPWPVRDFDKPAMRAWYETLIDHAGPAQAVALIRKMSLLFSYAELIGWRPDGSNPCARLRLSIPPGRARVASWAEFDALVAAADAAGLPSIGTAVALALHQGQRQTDILGATVGQFFPVAGLPKGLGWSLIRSKRGTSGAMIVHPAIGPRVRAALAAAIRRARRAGRDVAAEPVLWDERLGRPYDGDSFQRRWFDVRAAAAAAGAGDGIATLQFRDLRRTFGVQSRQGGASRDDAAEVLGNSAARNPQLAAIYMPGQFDSASRAVLAIDRPTKPERQQA